MEILPLVDEQDNEIGTVERSKRTKYQFYRVASLWIKNPEGEILIALRADWKDVCPNVWGPAVEGSVRHNKTYKDTILREAQEEIGLTINDITIGPKFCIREPTRSYIQQWFFTKTTQTEFHFDDNEVQEIRWVQPNQLIKEIKENPQRFMPFMLQWTEYFDKEKRDGTLVPIK